MFCPHYTVSKLRAGIRLLTVKLLVPITALNTAETMTECLLMNPHLGKVFLPVLMMNGKAETHILATDPIFSHEEQPYNSRSRKR